MDGSSPEAATMRLEVTLMSESDEIKGTGDTAPPGTYYCDKCGFAYEHKDEKEPLPRCPEEGIWTVWNPEPLKVREF